MHRFHRGRVDQTTFARECLRFWRGAAKLKLHLIHPSQHPAVQCKCSSVQCGRVACPSGQGGDDEVVADDAYIEGREEKARRLALKMAAQKARSDEQAALEDARPSRDA